MCGKKKQAFTMVEIVSTLVIIGILTALIAPKLINMASEAKQKAVAAGVSQYNAQEKLLWEKMQLTADSATLDNDALIDETIYQAMDFNLNSGSESDWVFTLNGGSAGTERNATLQFKGEDVDIFRTPATRDVPARWKFGSVAGAGESHSYDNIEQGGSGSNYTDPVLITGDGDDLIEVDDDISGDVTINTGGGNDTIIVGDDVQHGVKLDTGDGNDILTINGEVDDGTTINTGDGDDQCTIDDDLQDGSVVNTGEGKDTIQINDKFQDATLDSGAGDDTIIINRIEDNPTLIAGDGNDTVQINNVSSTFDTGQVSLGAGDDTLTVDDSLRGTDGTFSGGAGNDSIYLEDVSSRNWNRGIKDLFSGFETVTLKDGTFTLDENNNLTPK